MNVSTALAARPDQSLGALSTISLAEHFVKSGFFREVNDISKAVVKMQLGQEFGLGPMTSMMNVYIVEGKPSMGAHLIGALVRKAGYDYRVTDNTNQKCRIVFFDRQHNEMGESVFTIEDASKAQLSGKGNWAKYPKAMLFARAMSQGAKMHTPDATMGVIYTPDELGAEIEINESGDIIAVKDVTPTPTQAPQPPHDILTGEIIDPPQPAPTPIRTMASGVQLEQLVGMAVKYGQDEDALCKWLGIEALEDLTEQRAEKAIVKLRDVIAKREAAQAQQEPTAPAEGEPTVSLGAEYTNPAWAQEQGQGKGQPQQEADPVIDDFDKIPGGNEEMHSDKQNKAIWAIGKANSLSPDTIEATCQQQFGVRVSGLTKRQASDFIGELKDMGARS